MLAELKTKEGILQPYHISLKNIYELQKKHGENIVCYHCKLSLDQCKCYGVCNNGNLRKIHCRGKDDRP